MKNTKANREDLAARAVDEQYDKFAHLLLMLAMREIAKAETMDEVRLIERTANIVINGWLAASKEFNTKNKDKAAAYIFDE